MRVLVTGGAGFIGSHVVEAMLAQGHPVAVVDDFSTGKGENLMRAKMDHGEQMSAHRLDIRESAALEELFAFEEPEVVAHLAAQVDVRVSVARPAFDAQVNIVGTINVLEAARKTGVRKVIFTSSGGCIYGEPDNLPVAEDAPRRPDSPYGISKNVAEHYLRFYRKEHGLDYTALALANIYGPRQDPQGEAGVVAIFIGSLLKGKKPTIFGDGTQTRDFTYVGDVADAFVKSLERGSGELINIGTEKECSINELLALLQELCGREDLIPEFAPARAGELYRIAVQTAKARRLLGWAPEMDLREGLGLTVDWLKERTGVSAGK